MMPLTLCFVLRIVLGIWVFFLWLYTNFRIVFSVSVKNAIGIVIGMGLIQ